MYEEQEIDICDLSWRLIEQWRGLLTAGLLAVFFSLAFFNAHGAETDNDNEITSTDVVQEEIGKQTDELTDEKIIINEPDRIQRPEQIEIDPADVLTFTPELEYWTACNDLLLYADYNSIKKLNESSIISKSDFTDCCNVMLLYEFEVYGDSSDVLMINNVYSSIMSNGDFLKTVTGLIANDLNYNSLGDILTVTSSINTNNNKMMKGTISFVSTIPKSVGVNDWCRGLNKALIRYKNQVADVVCNHDIRALALNSKKGNDEYYVRLQNNKQLEIKNAGVAFENAMLNTSDETRKIVEAIISEKEDSIRYLDLKGLLDKRWQDYAEMVVKQQNEELRRRKDLAAEQYREELNRIEFEERLLREKEKAAAEEKARIEQMDVGKETVAEEKQKKTESAELNYIKQIFLSFFIGIFVYSMVYVLYFILYRVIRGDSELYSMSGLRNFGGIYEYPYVKRWQRFLFDRNIYKFRTRRKKMPNQVVDDLSVKLNHDNIREISIVSMGNCSKSITDVTDSIAQMLRDKGIIINEKNIPGYVRDETDSEFVGLKSVFLEVIGNQTKVENVRSLHQKLKEYDIAIIGYCYIEG